MPEEVIVHLDEAIDDLVNAIHLDRAAHALRGWRIYPTKQRRNIAKIAAHNSQLISRLKKLPRVALLQEEGPSGTRNCRTGTRSQFAPGCETNPMDSRSQKI
jgi:hypothetical protein